MAEIGRILVVGGGIAGLSTTIALQRAGYEPELVERAPAWPHTGAAIAMHANGVRALGELGVGRAIEEASAPIPAWIVADHEGHRLCATDLDALWKGVARCRGVTRVELHRALLAATDARIRLGIGVTDLRLAQTRVRAGFSDGTVGEYDLVVGADGIRSTIRGLILNAPRPAYTGVVSWRSVVNTRQQGVDELILLMGQGRFFGVVPLGGGATYAFASVGAESPSAARPSVKALREHFAGFGEPVRSYLAALERDEQIHAGPIEQIELNAWCRGRVVLVGDAARATPPHIGQGGSMAIEDGLVLAEVLRAADTVEAALDTFVARRRPRVTWVKEQTAEVAKAWLLPPEVRDGVLRERGDQMLQDWYRPLRELP